MVITKYPKSSSQQFGYALATPDGFVSTTKYPIVIVTHDSTRTGTGSSADLDLITSWSGFTDLKNAVDVFKFVILFVQSQHEFEYGEIQFAIGIAKALSYGDQNNIHFYGLDIGAFGFLSQAGIDAGVPSAFATVKLDMTKCVSVAIPADNIKAGNAPVWLSHAYDDPVFSLSCSFNMYNAIRGRGGSVWYTQYVTGQHAIHIRTLSAYNVSPNPFLPAAPTGNYAATQFSDPKMSWYQWVLSNKRGQPLIPPSNVYVPPVTKTLVATVRVYSDGSIENV